MDFEISEKIQVILDMINEFIDKLAYDSEHWSIFRQTIRLAAF